MVLGRSLPIPVELYSYMYSLKGSESVENVTNIQFKKFYTSETLESRRDIPLEIYPLGFPHWFRSCRTLVIALLVSDLRIRDPGLELRVLCHFLPSH